MAERDFEKEFEALRSDLGKVRADLAGVVEALKDSGKARAEAAKDSLGELLGRFQEEFREALGVAREKGRSSVETVEHQMEQRPLLSLFAAFGAGLLLGKILDRR
jgi:ElaB/YqjD/DUF883 family membrane-anchored ribosome-binding protein